MNSASNQSECVASKLIVLDRDGVINKTTPHKYCATWSEWEWTYRAPWAMKALVDEGYKLAIVTNQNGVSQGHYTENDFLQIMLMAETAMKDILGSDRYWPTVVCYCMHLASDGCECRKPGIKSWVEEICPVLGPVDYAASWMVGDRESDIEYGKRCGINTAKIPEDFINLHKFTEYLLEKEV